MQRRFAVKKILLLLSFVLLNLNGHQLSFGLQSDGQHLELLGQLSIDLSCVDDPFIKELSAIQPMSDRQWYSSVTQKIKALPEGAHDDFVSLCSRLLHDFDLLTSTDTCDERLLDFVEGCVTGLDKLIPTLQECKMLLLQFDELRAIHPEINSIITDIGAVLLHHYLTDARLFKPTLDSNGQLEEMEMSDATMSHLLNCLEFITHL